MGGLWGVESDQLVIRGGTGKIEYDGVLLVHIPAQSNSGIAVMLSIKVTSVTMPTMPEVLQGM